MEAASNLEPGRCLLGFMFQLKRKIKLLKKNIFNEKRLKYIKHESRGQYHQKREREPRRLLASSSRSFRASSLNFPWLASDESEDAAALSSVSTLRPQRLVEAAEARGLSPRLFRHAVALGAPDRTGSRAAKYRRESSTRGSAIRCWGGSVGESRRGGRTTSPRVLGILRQSPSTKTCLCICASFSSTVCFQDFYESSWVRWPQKVKWIMIFKAIMKNCVFRRT